MRFVSTFAGVGGFDLGFERAGWECVGQVELDKNARAVLEKHWPEVPKHDDICTAIEWADRVGLVGNVDLVAGGFPCQPFSVAGKRLGRDDLRGNLFWNALEFADHVEARHLVLENVPGILTVDSGRTFGEIVLSLGEAGFHHVEWRVLDSQWFGVPQRRRRVFIFASRDSGVVGGREVLVEREGLRWHPPQGWQARQETAGTLAGGAGGGGVLAERGITQALTAGLASGGPDAAHAQAGRLVPADHLSLASSSAMQDVASTITTGTGIRYDPDTESLVVVREVEEGAVR